MLLQPVLLFLAGPNGSGKTTFFEAYLEPLGLPYVDADRIARLLRASDPNVSRDSIDRHAFHEARGFAVFLVFIGPESGALSIARVQQRVQQGRTRRPDDRLRARFPRTLANPREAVTLAVRQQLV